MSLKPDWYATVLFTKPQHVVLLVNAAIRLPVVVPARGLSALPTRFAVGLVASELREMQDVTFRR